MESSNIVNSILSPELKRVANKLIKDKVPITFYGKAWSANKSNWIYFDKILDLNKIRSEFNLGSDIIEHKNLDPKSGLESGFIDVKTEEGLMGKLI